MELKKLSKKDLAILRKLFDDCAYEPKYPNFIRLLRKKRHYQKSSKRKEGLN